VLTSRITAVLVGGTTAGGADEVVWRIFPTDRRTGTGGGVEGRLRRGVFDWVLVRLLDENCLLGTADWLLGIGISGGGKHSCSRGASMDDTFELAAGRISELPCTRLSGNWLSYAGRSTIWLFNCPSVEELLSTEAEEDNIWWWWWWWWRWWWACDNDVDDAGDLVSAVVDLPECDSGGGRIEAMVLVMAGRVDRRQCVFWRDAWITNGVITTPGSTHHLTIIKLNHQTIPQVERCKFKLFYYQVLLVSALNYHVGDRQFKSRFGIVISSAPPVHLAVLFQLLFFSFS